MKSQSHTNNGHVISFLPDGEYYFEKGMLAYQRGDLQRAKKFTERAIVFNPNQTDYLCQLAAILAELELYEASNSVLKKVVFEVDPGQVECFFFMANNFAHLGFYEEALRDVKKYISLEPNGPFFQEARELYQLLISETGFDFEDEEEEAYISDHEKGRQALERGIFQKAIYYFQKVIKERPNYWAAQNNLAIAYFSSGQTEKALEQLELILEKDPGNVHALCNLVTFHHQSGNSDVVQALLPRLEIIYPVYPEHRSKLGATFFFLNHYEKAYYWLSSAERSGMFTNQSFHYWLAVSAYRIGKAKQAQKAWEHVDFFSESPFQPLEYGKLKEFIKETDARSNPLVRSLFNHQAEDGELDAQLVSLFYLFHFGDEDAIERLKSLSQSKHLESGLLALTKGLLMRLKGQTENQDARLDLMFKLQESLGNGAPLLDHLGLYSWWYTLFLHLEPRHVNVICYAAALEYRWVKHVTQEKVTQTDVSQKYEISVYRLRRHLSLLEDWELPTE